MSAVLKKLSLIQPFHRKSGLAQRHKHTQEEVKPAKRTTYQIDLGAPNNNEEYVRKIQDRIILKLVAPGLSVSTTNCEAGEGGSAKGKPAVEHIEDKGKRGKKDKAKDAEKNGKIGNHVSKRLNEERIKKMIELDELYFKKSELQTGM